MNGGGRRRAPTALVLALLSVLAACTPSAPRLSAPNGDLMARLIARSRDLGPLDPSAEVSVVAMLADQSAARLQSDAEERYRPGSPSFGRFETPEGFMARYGASRDLVAGLTDELADAGLTIDWQPGNSWAVIRGPVRRMEATFSIQVHAYVARSGARFYASAIEPRVPEDLRPSLVALGAVTDYPKAKPKAVPPGGLKPVDVLSAYDIRPLRDQGIDGSGEKIVFLELDGYDQADLDAFSSQFGLPAMRPSERGGARSVPKAEGETTMDLEVAHAIAPGASLVLYTVDTRTTEGQFLQMVDRMVTENPGAVISISLGQCEQSLGAAGVAAESALFDKAAQLGESVFVSSGDSGAYECLTRDWGARPSDAFLGVPTPASSSGVTSVGGTRISVRQDSSYYNETAWVTPAETAGTGGGFSRVIRRPSWQQAPGVDAAPGQGARLVPDVAADADPASGVAIRFKGKWETGGGTSQAAPLWAGIAALLNQYLKRQGVPPVGFMNPALYALASGRPQFSPFHDVTIGSNLTYPAGAGYDLATGLGSPDVWNLARDLEAYQRGGGGR